MTTASAVPAPVGDSGQARMRVPPVAQSPRPRRRPHLLALGVALAVTGGLVAAWLFAGLDDSVAVVAVAQDVQRGEVIEAGDLTTARITDDAVLNAVPAARLDELVGQRAAVDLTTGGLVTEGSVTTEAVPGDGESVVGVTLTRAQLPSEPLLIGDRVRFVATPGSQGEVTEDDIVTYGATVTGVTPYETTGEVVVDVVVGVDDAPMLAAQAATGQIALVLDSRAR